MYCVELSMHLLLRFGLVATIAAAFVANAITTQADPKATPKPTATPELHFKEGKFALEKDKIVEAQAPPTPKPKGNSDVAAQHSDKKSSTKSDGAIPSAKVSPSPRPRHSKTK